MLNAIESPFVGQGQMLPHSKTLPIDWGYYRSRDRYMAPVVRCASLKGMLLYFDQFQEDIAEKLLEGLSYEKEYYFDTSNWTNFIDAHQIAWNIHENFPQTTLDDWVKVGGNIANDQTAKIFEAVIPFISLKYMYSMLPLINRNFNDTISCESIVVRNGHADFKITVDKRFSDIDHGYLSHHFAGVVAMIPTAKGKEPAQTRILYCQSKLRNIITFLYHSYGLSYDEKQDGVYVSGRKIAMPIRLLSERVKGKEVLGERYEVDKTMGNGFIMVEDLCVNGVQLLRKGEIYNAPYTRMQFDWQKKTAKGFFSNFFKPQTSYKELFQDVLQELRMSENRFREADAARKRAVKAESELHSYAERLEMLVEKRSRQMTKAHEQLIEADKKVLEKQIAGGFAHEIRNALTGAQIELHVTTSDGGKSATSTIQSEATAIAEQLYLLSERYNVPTDIADRLLRKTNNIVEHGEQLRTVLAAIAREIERGINITAQLRDYTKLSETIAGDSDIELLTLMRRYKDKYRNVCKKQNVEFKVSGVNGATIQGDTVHLDSIFSNLIGNSIKALQQVQREEKFISIDIVKKNLEGHGSYSIFIKDNGLGMDHDTLKNIFKPFFSNKHFSGTGLGMSIVARLLNLYRGSIEIESEPGEGTCIEITLFRNRALEPCTEEILKSS